MLVPFCQYKSVSEAQKQAIQTQKYYSSTGQSGVDRARLIEDNKEALDIRLYMIEQAKEEIILTSFDIREGDSTMDTFSALLKAADRGVKVKILVDGLCGTLHMRGKEIFQVVGSHSNVEIRFYNSPNLLKPWTMQGCLHDKYLVIDNKYLLMGGRNNFDYFLGDYTDKSIGLDREIFIVNTGVVEESAIGQVKNYFNSVWNLEVCKNKFTTCSKKKINSWEEKLLAHEKTLQIPNFDDIKDTYPTKKITLVTNPTHIFGKEPYVFETLCQLMKQAKNKVIIHTPYVVCSEDMYQGISGVVKNVPNTTMLVNSIAVGDNVCASADYLRSREDILSTGINVEEYMGNHSMHAKSVVIDDELAIVGSFNFDCRSTYVDTEMMLVVHGEEIATQLDENIEKLEKDALVVKADGSYEAKENITPKVLEGKKKFTIKFLSYAIMVFRYLI